MSLFRRTPSTTSSGNSTSGRSEPRADQRETRVPMGRYVCDDCGCVASFPAHGRNCKSAPARTPRGAR